MTLVHATLDGTAHKLNPSTIVTYNEFVTLLGTVIILQALRNIFRLIRVVVRQF